MIISKTPFKHLKHQQGAVSLQNIFWVIGIIVGLLSIVQVVLPYVISYRQGSSASKPENTEESVPTADTANATDTSEVTEAPPKLAVLDSPSVKIGKYTAYDNGIAVDTTLGIIWMRCSLGQEWNGSNCTGSAKAYSLDKAKLAIEQLNKVSYVGLYNWQLPDIEALQSLIYCSDGYQGSYSIPLSSSDRSDAKKTVSVDCKGNFKVPTINDKVFPDTQWAIWRGYWSNSLNDEGEPLTVYFNTGEIKAKNKPHYVRAMRYLDSQ